MTAIARHQDRGAHSGPGTEVVRRPRRDESTAESARRNRRVVEICLAIGTPIALLGIWELASRAGWIDPRLYPAPSTIFREGRELVSDGELVDDTLVTLRRTLQGYVIGVIAGIALGSVMGNLRLVRVALETTLNGLYVIPKLAIFPVLLTIFGIGDAPKIALGIYTVFFYMWISSMEAFTQVPDGYREAARSLGLSRTRTFCDVLLPAALPQIFVGMRIAMNVAILVNIAAEMVASSNGLGHLINEGRQLFRNSQMFVGIVTVAVIGIALAAAVTWLGRRMTPWAPRGSSHAHGG